MSGAPQQKKGKQAPVNSKYCYSELRTKFKLLPVAAGDFFFGGGAQLGGAGGVVTQNFFLTLNIYVLAMLDAVVLSYYFFNA